MRMISASEHRLKAHPALLRGLWARTEPWLPVLGVLLAVGLGAVGAYRAIGHTSDFRGFYEPARALIRTGHVPVDRYPPTFHLLVAPLALLPLWAAALVWQGLNVASLILLPVLLARLMSVPPARQALSWLVVLPFVWDNLVLGQSGPGLLFLVTAGLLWIRDRMPVRGGVLLGAATLIKVIPGVFLLIPAALGRRRRTALGFAIAGLVSAAVLVGALGLRDSAAWAGRWVSNVARHHTGEGMLETMHGVRYNNQSVLATLGRTFGDVPVAEARGATRIANLPPSAISGINDAILLALLGWTLAAAICARRIPAEKAWGAVGALTALLVLLLSPVVWTHYFIWWLPAVVYLSRRRLLLVCLGVLSGAALCSVTLRGLGAHLVVTLVLYGTILADIFKHRPRGAMLSPGAAEKEPGTSRS